MNEGSSVRPPRISWPTYAAEWMVCIGWDQLSNDVVEALMEIRRCHVEQNWALAKRWQEEKEIRQLRQALFEKEKRWKPGPEQKPLVAPEARIVAHPEDLPLWEILKSQLAGIVNVRGELRSVGDQFDEALDDLPSAKVARSPNPALSATLLETWREVRRRFDELIESLKRDFPVFK